MAQARYTVQRPFEHNGEKMKLGYILVLDTVEAQSLLEGGSLRFDKYLNPQDPKDATEIDFFRGNPSGKRRAKPVATSQPMMVDPADDPDDSIGSPSAPLPPEETTDQESEEVVEEATEASTDEQKPEEAAASEEKQEEPPVAPAPKKTDAKKKGK